MNIREWPRCHRGTIESQFFLQSSGIYSTSPYSGQSTPYGPQSQRWVCKLTFPQKRGPDWRELSGLIASLRGITNLVRMVDYHRMRPGYDVAVSPSVANWNDDSNWDDGTGWEGGYLPPSCAIDEAADRDDDSIVLRGLPASLARVLRQGDLFEIRPNGVKADHGHLYECVRDCRSNSDGKTRVYFEPGLRAGVAPGDQVVLRYPSSLFRLASDSEGVIARSLGNLGSLGLSLTEVLP